MSSSRRPEPHSRGGGSQPSQADSPLPEQDEEILGSDDDEQEDPNDYCKGAASRQPAALSNQTFGGLSDCILGQLFNETDV